MIALPHPDATKLQNLVATLRLHGNTPETLNLERIASFNLWTSADELRAEFQLQQNGKRKLPEEVAASEPTVIPYNSDGGEE